MGFSTQVVPRHKNGPPIGHVNASSSASSSTCQRQNSQEIPNVRERHWNGELFNDMYRSTEKKEVSLFSFDFGSI